MTNPAVDTRAQSSSLWRRAPLLLNVALLCLLAWHIGFEALPGVANDYRGLTGILDRCFAVMPFFPYIVLIAFVIRSPRVLATWRAAALVPLAMLLYVALSMAAFLLIHRGFFPLD
ncbi:hypothetical protein M8A51_19245 [Schlegelella sp. S2-27]|uniref:Uncharacterized protein n=1 Tax=Caldimonas mangrovi TaxID=2944811 RepID=A0ABT0YSF0_9BURK|nr:hypothetical protein [Caldimonas mangrovi]MCM5681667.1 hypothetical protein [Caldimonas mangrovi]